jgi:site-specific recombinase
VDGLIGDESLGLVLGLGVEVEKLLGLELAEADDPVLR